jgi:hypothetical protein
MDDPGNGQGSWFRPASDGGGDWLGLNGDTPSRRQRPQPSGAQNRRVARERAAKALAATGQLELKLLVNVADFELLVQTGDLSEDDLTNPVRFAAAMVELLPEMARCYAAEQLRVLRRLSRR